MSDPYPLCALVYRAGRGCRQYSFATPDELETWARRHPYRKEEVLVLAYRNGREVGQFSCAAPAAAQRLRELFSQNRH